MSSAARTARRCASWVYGRPRRHPVSMAKVILRDEMLQRLATLRKITPAGEANSAPATRFLLPDGTVFGIIASTTAPFCRTCDRSRITADGFWYRCLYATGGTDLRKLVRGGAGSPSVSRKAADAAIDTAIARVIEESWRGREDRGAEERAARNHREAFVRIEELRRESRGRDRRAPARFAKWNRESPLPPRCRLEPLRAGLHSRIACVRDIQNRFVRRGPRQLFSRKHRRLHRSRCPYLPGNRLQRLQSHQPDQFAVGHYQMRPPSRARRSTDLRA